MKGGHEARVDPAAHPHQEPGVPAPQFVEVTEPGGERVQDGVELAGPPRPLAGSGDGPGPNAKLAR